MSTYPSYAAGTLVNPGDAGGADDDGIVIVPRAQMERVAAAAEREKREAQVGARLAAGEWGPDIHGCARSSSSLV